MRFIFSTEFLNINNFIHYLFFQEQISITADLLSKGSEKVGQMTKLIDETGDIGAMTKGFGNVMRGTAFVGNLVTTGIAGYQVYNQYRKGGVTEVMHHRAILDATVGTAGLVATIFLASNPVGWAISGGALIYGIGTMIYDETFK